MPYETALKVVAFGEVDQTALDQLRAELSLRRAGRLSDTEDAEFGYREEQSGGADGSIVVWLWREGADTWSLDLSYQGLPPPDELVDQYRARFSAAFARAGLVVNREWRR